MIKKLFKDVIAQREAERRAELHRNLIRHGARIGGQLFGPVPVGGRREFFCLDKYTWVWYEEWVDNATGQRRNKTTQYSIRPNGILKSQNGHYQPVTDEEIERLYQAAKQYETRLRNELPAYV